MGTPTENRNADREPDSEFLARWRGCEEELLAFCRKLTGREQDAQDVAEETLEEAWADYRSFRGQCTFFTWLAAVARHRTADLRRRKARQRRRETPLRHEHESVPAPPETPCRCGGVGWLVAVVSRAVEADHLTHAEAAVLLAKVSQPNADWDEIGVSLEKTAAQCRDAFRHAKTGLRVYLIVHCADLLGGMPAIAHAFDSANADKKRGMTPREAEAFEEIVLKGGSTITVAAGRRRFARRAQGFAGRSDPRALPAQRKEHRSRRAIPRKKQENDREPPTNRGERRLIR